MIIKDKQLDRNGDMWVTLEYVGNRITKRKINKEDLFSLDLISVVREKFGTDKVWRSYLYLY